MSYLDCDDCVIQNNRIVRGTLHCGWLPSREWSGPGFPCPDEWPQRDEECTVCPGYLVRLPKVREAERAAWWAEKSLLAARYEHYTIPGVLMDAIEIFRSSVSDVEAYMLQPKDGK